VPTPYSSILPTSLCRSRGLFVLLNARPHSWRINKPLPFNGLHTLQKGVSASPTFQSSCALFEKHRGGIPPKSESPAKPLRKDSAQCAFRPTRRSIPEMRHFTPTRRPTFPPPASCETRTLANETKPWSTRQRRASQRKTTRFQDNSIQRENNAWKGITSKEEKRGDRCLIR
jgi:hypothetical protein